MFFDDVKFPSVNPVEYKVKRVPSDQNSKDLHIQNYMYPAACGNKDPNYKGAILFTHGFTDYGGMWAHVGEMFSKENFDFFMMDSEDMEKAKDKPYMSLLWIQLLEMSGVIIKPS